MDKERSKNNVGQSSSSNGNDQRNQEKKYAFYRKPSFKKKGPLVKQTKTSMKRLMIANPLLKYEQEGIDLLKLKDDVAEGTVDSSIKEKILQNSFSTEKINRSKEINIPSNNKNIKRVSSFISGNLADDMKPKSLEGNKMNTLKQSVPDFKSFSMDIVSSNKNYPTTSKSSKYNKLEQEHVSKSKPRNPIRRSISAQHFKSKKSGNSNTLSKNKLSRSSDALDHDKLLPNEFQYHQISPIAERSREHSYVFKTPTAYERRSVISTPLSAANRRSIYRPTTPLPTLNDLQKRLNDWLLKRGKSVSLFNNLKCFQEPELIDEENKENVEGKGNVDLGSYEDLRIQQNHATNVTEEINALKVENTENLAKAAIVDLQKLLLEGFPSNQCYYWLELIKEKCPKISDEPEYWECRAAIEESRGNVGNAVECYKTAIVQGAQVQEVDKSLDVLLQKFSLLDISSEYKECEKMTKERVRIIKDARNVFKSSIIKFAVQQKKMKKENESKLVVTPVRRSTRLSRSVYTSTPGVKVCSSLKELQSPERSLASFQKNKALE